MRNPLGLALANIVAGEQRPSDLGDFVPRVPDYAGGIHMPAEPAKPAYSKGQIIAGILADALAGIAGQPGPSLARWNREREQDREQQREEAQWGLQRRARLEDYEAQKQIDQRYTTGPAPTEFERILQASGINPGTPEWMAAMGRRRETMLNPMMPMTTVDANGNPAVAYVPRNPPGGPPTSERGSVSGPPEAAVQHLRQNPQLRDAFDAKYGQGMADRYLGGGASNGTGGFPR